MSTPSGEDRDAIRRFVFEEAGVRGEWVQLEASWQAVLERHVYPSNVQRQLGEALAAVVLLSTTIKFNGTLILQAQGSGPLRTLVAQATDQRTFRGLARWQDEVPDGDLASVYGDGRLVLTVQTEDAPPYQGVVALQGGLLAHALEDYFDRSEQLPTRFWLAADGQRAAGLFLQQLPPADPDGEDWSRLVTLANTVRRDELLGLASRDILRRLFHEETLRLFDAESVRFRCGCSRGRMAQTLALLGLDDLRAAIAEQQGEVAVTCEFCNRSHRFDRIDIEQLFADGFAVDGTPTAN